MRPLVFYFIVIAAVAVAGMFFVSQRSRQVQIGYELTQLRRERRSLIERRQKLDYRVSRAAGHDVLAAAAARLRLVLEPPGAEESDGPSLP